MTTEETQGFHILYGKLLLAVKCLWVRMTIEGIQAFPILYGKLTAEEKVSLFGNPLYMENFETFPDR